LYCAYVTHSDARHVPVWQGSWVCRYGWSRDDRGGGVPGGWWVKVVVGGGVKVVVVG